MPYLVFAFETFLQLAALAAFAIFLGVCAGLYTGVIL